MEAYKKLDKREFIEVYKDYICSKISREEVALGLNNRRTLAIFGEKNLEEAINRDEIIDDLYKHYIEAYKECGYNYLAWIERRTRNGNL